MRGKAESRTPRDIRGAKPTKAAMAVALHLHLAVSSDTKSKILVLYVQGTGKNRTNRKYTEKAMEERLP